MYIGIDALEHMVSLVIASSLMSIYFFHILFYVVYVITLFSFFCSFDSVRFGGIFQNKRPSLSHESTRKILLMLLFPPVIAVVDDLEYNISLIKLLVFTIIYILKVLILCDVFVYPSNPFAYLVRSFFKEIYP